MSKLMSCGVCCACLSVWGIVQLCLMGIFYHVETAILIEDVHAHKEHYSDYQSYVKETRHNYKNTARNCWIAAAGYFVTLILSFVCIHKSKKDAIKEELLKDNDELICMPKTEPGIVFKPDTIPNDNLPMLHEMELVAGKKLPPTPKGSQSPKTKSSHSPSSSPSKRASPKSSPKGSSKNSPKGSSKNSPKKK